MSHVFTTLWWWCRASCPRMSADILGTNCDQCLSMVQCCFTSTETVRLIRTESPGRPPRLSHSSWTLSPLIYKRILFEEACLRRLAWKRLQVFVSGWSIFRLTTNTSSHPALSFDQLLHYAFSSSPHLSLSLLCAIWILRHIKFITSHYYTSLSTPKR